MSHEIGNEDDVMLEKSAWHRLGKVVGKLFGWADAIAEDLPITRGVSKVGLGEILATGLLTSEGVTPLRAQPNEYASVRSDGLVIATGLGEQWTPFHAAEGYEFGQVIRDSAEGTGVQCDLKSLGTLYNGRKWFMTFDLGQFSIGDYKVRDYLSVNGSYDSSWPLQVLTGPTIEVCANTVALNQAHGMKHYRFKHTSGIFDRVAEAKRALGRHNDNRASFVELGNKLLSAKVEPAEFVRLVRAMFPVDDDTSTKVANAHTEAQARVAQVFYEDDRVDEANGFGFVQAVNTYENWHQPIRRTAGRSTDITRALRQVEQLNAGGQKLTDTAIDLVLATV